jgi:hypothetical protein
MTRTIAEKLADTLNTNGLSKHDLVTLSDKADHIERPEYDVTKWFFGDDSVITECGGGWDLGYPDCDCWQGAEHTCGA